MYHSGTLIKYFLKSKQTKNQQQQTNKQQQTKATKCSE
jgi:hypothetical protein